MNTNELIDYYFRQKQDGMGFGEIRRQLESTGLKPETIKTLIQLIDNKVLLTELQKAAARKARERIAVGLILTVAGLGLTLASLTGFFGMKNNVILAYGPIAGGLGILGSGLAQGRKASRMTPNN